MRLKTQMNHKHTSFPNKLGLSTRLHLVVFAAIALWPGSVVSALSQTADSFDPNAASGSYGILAMAVQPDNKIVICGAFTNVGGVARTNFARLDVDGNLEVPFDPEPNAAPQVLAVQTDGKILVGGDFTALGGVTHNHIGRLNYDGSLDTNFTAGTDGPVYGLLVQGDGKILVWGEFTQLAGQPRTRIGRLKNDGSLDTSFDPGSGADDSIFTVALQQDGKFIVGGYNFGFAGHACHGIARLNGDGSFDDSFQPIIAFTDYKVIYGLVLQPDGKVLASSAERPTGFSNFDIYTRRFKTDGSLDATTKNGVGFFNSTTSVRESGARTATDSAGGRTVSLFASPYASPPRM